MTNLTLLTRVSRTFLYGFQWWWLISLLFFPKVLWRGWPLWGLLLLSSFQVYSCTPFWRLTWCWSLVVQQLEVVIQSQTSKVCKCYRDSGRIFYTKPRPDLNSAGWNTPKTTPPKLFPQCFWCAKFFQDLTNCFPPFLGVDDNSFCLFILIEHCLDCHHGALWHLSVLLLFPYCPLCCLPSKTQLVCTHETIWTIDEVADDLCRAWI